MGFDLEHDQLGWRHVHDQDGPGRSCSKCGWDWTVPWYVLTFNQWAHIVAFSLAYGALAQAWWGFALGVVFWAGLAYLAAIADALIDKKWRHRV